ncbi:hypothetical protein ACU4GH_31380 [Bradyrhizobium betae]
MALVPGLCAPAAAMCAYRHRRAGLGLGYHSRTLMHDLVAREKLDFDYQRNGKLVVYRDPAAFAGARRQLDYQAGLGSSQQALDGAACVALGASAGPSGRPTCRRHHIRPKRKTPAIAMPSPRTGRDSAANWRHARARVAVSCGERVTGLRREGRAVVAVQTGRGRRDRGDAWSWYRQAWVAGVPLMSGWACSLPMFPLTGLQPDRAGGERQAPAARHQHHRSALQGGGTRAWASACALPAWWT